jgi:hypothetical protein
MSWPAKELTVLAATQRKKGHEEALALASALAATKGQPRQRERLVAGRAVPPGARRFT